VSSGNSTLGGRAITGMSKVTGNIGSGSGSRTGINILGATVPGAPTIGTAVAGNATAQVPYTAPASNGGSAITSYTATSTPGNITGTLSQAGSGTITVNGLANDTSYTFTVHATNAAGNSAESAASNSISAGFNLVVLLMHMDGSNGSTTFTDQIGHTFTVGGGAQISTAQYKFGGASGLYNGTNAYITTPRTAEWAWPSQDYTVEMWCRTNTDKTNGAYGPVQIGEMAPTTLSQDWSFGTNATGKIQWYYWNGSAATFVTGTTTVTTGTWHHLAMTLSGTTIRLFIDGVQDATGTISGTPDVSTSAYLVIGACNSVFYDGYIDDVRITKGLARYTSNFTPPTAAFPNS